MFSARQGFFPVATGGFFATTGYWPNSASQLLSFTPVTNTITWNTTAGFTVEYWCYFVSWPTGINPGPGNQNGVGNNFWSFGPTASGQLEFYYWTGATRYLNTATGALSLNTWNNIAIVFTTSGTTTTATMYINGTRTQIQKDRAGAFADSQTTTNTPQFNTATGFGIGRYSSTQWNAYMDNLRVSRTARYSGASYTVATSPFSSDANTQLLMYCNGANNSTTFTDSGINAYTITNASNIVIQTTTRGNHT